MNYDDGFGGTKESEVFNINFNSTKDDTGIVWRIAHRAVDNGIYDEPKDAAMDVTATHLNGNPIRLQDLLDSDDGTFNHDLSGIKRYLNRETGELTDFWTPRMSK